jgi:hypothetical protein
MTSSFNIVAAFIVNRLARTGYIKRQDEPNQEDFDRAYEADIEAIVEKYLRWKGLTE